MIYTDGVRGFLTDHLSEEGLERICMAKDVDAIERDAHISVCQMCKIRVLDTTEFIRVMRDALAIDPDVNL